MHIIKSILVLAIIGFGGVSMVFANPVAQAQVATASVAKVNINTSSSSILKEVPGLNAAKARAIVAYRKKNGLFVSLSTLKKVSGFKRMEDKKFQDIQQHFSLN